MSNKNQITITVAGSVGSGKSIIMSMIQKYFDSFSKDLGPEFKINYEVRSINDIGELKLDAKRLKTFLSHTRFVLEETSTLSAERLARTKQIEQLRVIGRKQLEEATEFIQRDKRESAYTSAMKVFDFQN